jgi:hypothetical protein
VVVPNKVEDHCSHFADCLVGISRRELTIGCIISKVVENSSDVFFMFRMQGPRFLLDGRMMKCLESWRSCSSFHW